MTDQMIPADAVRDIIARHRDGASHRGGMILDDLKALLPTPPRPTLADMTPVARRECQWMQCDVEDGEARAVIINPHWMGESARVLWPGAFIEEIEWERVTPRPDLPRLEWPSTGQDGEEATKVDYVSVAGGRTAYGPWTVARLRKKADTAPALPEGWRLADHKGYGRGIVTNPTPTRDGRVYFVLPADDPMGYDWIFCTPDELTYLEQGADTSDTVPESTLSVGSVWKNANALTRACSESGRDQIVVIDKNGDVGVWDAGLLGWRAYAPGPVFAPYTIIHTGREADQ